MLVLSDRSMKVVLKSTRATYPAGLRVTESVSLFDPVRVVVNLFILTSDWIITQLSSYMWMRQSLKETEQAGHMEIRRQGVLTKNQSTNFTRSRDAPK